MTNTNELEKKAAEEWAKAEKEKKVGESMIQDYPQTIEGVYHQNLALHYENQIIIQNGKDILDYLNRHI